MEDEYLFRITICAEGVSGGMESSMKYSFRDLKKVYMGEDFTAKSCAGLITSGYLSLVLLLAIFFLYPIGIFIGISILFYYFLLFLAVSINILKLKTYKRLTQESVKSLMVDQISYSLALIIYVIVNYVLYKDKLVLDFILIGVSIVLIIPYARSNERIIRYSDRVLSVYINNL